MLLIALIVLGCSHIPTRSPPYVLCEPNLIVLGYGIGYCGAEIDPRDLQLYLEAFEEAWRQDPDVPHDAEVMRLALQNLDIYFQEGVFSRPGISGSNHLLGLTYPFVSGRALVFVIQPVGGDLSTTALAHELIHVAYGALEKNPHGEHFGERYEWPEKVLRIVRHTNLLYEERKR